MNTYRSTRNFNPNLRSEKFFAHAFSRKFDLKNIAWAYLNNFYFTESELNLESNDMYISYSMSDRGIFKKRVISYCMRNFIRNPFFRKMPRISVYNCCLQNFQKWSKEDATIIEMIMDETDNKMLLFIILSWGTCLISTVCHISGSAKFAAGVSVKSLEIINIFPKKLQGQIWKLLTIDGSSSSYFLLH